MLMKLGGIIEKKPWLVVSIIILITIGFSLFLPALEFRTDFRDFMPDDDLVQANMRILDYFGDTQQIILVYIGKQKAQSTLTSDAIREQFYIQKEVEKLPEVATSIGIATFIDQVCWIEFGDSLENCTDDQILIALQDILEEEESDILQVFDSDDPNELIDINPYPALSRGKSIDSLDIKNCYISGDNTSMTFSIEVYDLSSFQSTLKPPHRKINVLEWFIEFENLILPDERLDIDFKLAAHIEPSHELWELGRGIGQNLRSVLQHFRSRELFNSYKKEAYLWIKPPDQEMYFPIPLQHTNVTFDFGANRIDIEVSQKELESLGIVPQMGSFQLPVKLSNFKAGVRYYQTPSLKLPWTRITINTSFLLNTLQRMQTRPLLNTITTRLLQRFGDITWDESDEFFSMSDTSGLLPEHIALKDMENNWIELDRVPDEGVSTAIFSIRPEYVDEIKLNTISFLSEDYTTTNEPMASLIIVQLNVSFDDFEQEEIIAANNKVVNRLKELDTKHGYVSIEVTGEGVITGQINEMTEEANQIIMPMIFIVIIIILFISFKQTSYVLLPMLCLVVATIWVFGTMALLGMAFNTIAIAIVPLIVGLGVDYSVHLLHNYRAELDKGNSPAVAIKRSVRDIGTAMFLAMLTTVIAFMSFLSADIPPVRNLGFLLAIGIIFTFITAITLLASIRYILDRRKATIKRPKQRSYSLRSIMWKTPGVILRHQKKILVIMCILSVVMLSGAIQLKTGFDLYEFLPEENEALQLFEKISEEFPFAGQYQEYILLEGDVATVDALEGLRKTHTNIEDDTWVARKPDGSVNTVSIYTILQQAVKNNKSLIAEFNLDTSTGIPHTDRDVKRLYDYFFDIEEYQALIQTILYKNESRYEAAVIRVYLDITLQGRETVDLTTEMKVLRRELEEDIASYGDAQAIATGQYIITLSITSSLTESQILSTGISFIFAAIVLMIAYRKPTLGLICMIPVGVSILWVLGTMQFIGYSLNVMTVMVTSLTIGMGIDYAIHTTERFKLVADKTGDVEKAVAETIGHTGGALLIAALTTAAGFGILVFSPMPPQAQFGVILAMTITYAFITSVLILPLALVRWGRWRKRRKGYIISPKKAESFDDNAFISSDERE